MLKTNFLKIIAIVNKGHIEALAEGRHATRRVVRGGQTSQHVLGQLFCIIWREIWAGLEKVHDRAITGRRCIIPDNSMDAQNDEINYIKQLRNKFLLIEGLFITFLGCHTPQRLICTLKYQ